MYYIQEDSFVNIMKAATRVITRDPWSIQKRLKEYPVIRRWDSGEKIAPSSGEWEEQARLIDAGSELFLETQEVYHGIRYCDKAPEFYRVPRRAAEALQ